VYFWNIKKLKADLISNEVSQRDIMYYLLASTILTVGVIESMRFLPQESVNMWDYIDAMSRILITVIGVIWVYRSNGGNLGVRFAERYLAIAWVTLIRFMVLLVLVFFAMALITFDEQDSGATKWWHVLIVQAWYLGYFWRVVKHTNDVANAT